MRRLHINAMTGPGLASNYYGDGAANRQVLQKVTKDGQFYPTVGSGAIRAALREMLADYDVPLNRSRLPTTLTNTQISVSFKDIPQPDKYADDFIFGYMLALKNTSFLDEALKAKKIQIAEYQTKRDSVLQVNTAVALNPYAFDVFLRQSSQVGQAPWVKAKKAGASKPDEKENSEETGRFNSALFNPEVVYTAFQYPIALDLSEAANNPTWKRWLRTLVVCIAQMNGVGGNHTRSLYNFEPRSVVVRLTRRLAPGYDLYGFKEDGTFPSAVEPLAAGHMPGNEFYLGGHIIETLTPDQRQKLEDNKVHLLPTAEAALMAAAKDAGL
jgi:CRISPR-associated protein Cst2